MNRRYFPIAAVTAALTLVAVFGYLHIAPARDMPARMVLDNAGGRVLFSHGHHAGDLGLDCGDCHHDGADPKHPEACGACHPAAFDAAYAEGHAKSFTGTQACSRCHAGAPAPDRPTDRPDVTHVPLRADAFHGQCLGCHEQMGAGPSGEKSCNACHQQRK